MTTTKTPNGIRIGDQVTFVEFGTPLTCTVVGFKDGGLRVWLAENGENIGYSVHCRDVTPVAETTEVAETTDTTPVITAGAKVAYSGNYRVPITHTVIGITSAGNLRLDDGFGDVGFPVSPDQVTLVEAASAATVEVEPESTPEPIPADGTIGSTATLDGTPVVIVAQPGSSGYRPASRGHQCHLGIGCHYVEISPVSAGQAAPASAWLCELDTDLVEQATATAAELGASARRPIPARTGTRMSPTAANVIADLGAGAQIGRGRGFGRLNVTQLRCLHDRGYVVAILDPQQPTRITGAVITAKGVQRALQIVTYTLAA